MFSLSDFAPKNVIHVGGCGYIRVSRSYYRHNHLCLSPKSGDFAPSAASITPEDAPRVLNPKPMLLFTAFAVLTAIRLYA